MQTEGFYDISGMKHTDENSPSPSLGDGELELEYGRTFNRSLSLARLAELKQIYELRVWCVIKLPHQHKTLAIYPSVFIG